MPPDLFHCIIPLPTTHQRLVLLYLACLLLSNSYAPEPNPGPSPHSDPSTNGATDPAHSQTHSLSQTHSSWICGTCDLQVHWSDRGLACDQCGQWFHGQCQSIDTKHYDSLANCSKEPWYCAVCGSPNSITAFDLHGVDWSDSPFPDLPNSCGTPTDQNFRPFHASTPTRANQQDKSKYRPLRIINVNFQSASSKRAELPNLLDSMKPDVILGTETWLDPSIATAEIFPNSYNYKVYRRDRGGRGGGVLIAVRNNLESYIVPELENDDCELIWVRLKLKGRRTLYLGAYYRPDVADEQSLLKFSASLHRASQQQNACLLVGGDFNFPGLDWESATLKTKSPCPRLHNDFLSLVYDNGLEQLVKEPTRDDNTLDLFLTNCPQLVPRVEVVPGLSDHNIPYCEFNICVPRKKQQQREILLYNRADWPSLRRAAIDLSTELQQMQDTATTEELWTTFKEKLQKAVKSSVPHRLTRTKVNQPWVTADLRRLINKKDRIYRCMKKTGSDHLRARFKDLRRTIQRLLRRSYWCYLNNILTGEDDPDRAGKNKRFWTYVKNQKSSCVGVAPLKKDGQLTSDPMVQAEVLNAQFQSVFGDGATYTDEDFQTKIGTPALDIPPMDAIHITPHGVKKLMMILDPNKATGPDGISPRILKELAEELAPGLTTIFQSSLATGLVPADWKDAHVTPIYKKGEQYDPANYRPVSLTCVACKLMEHVVVSAMMQHFDAHNVLADNQHGFRRGRSCETQLLGLTEELMSNLEGGKQTDVLVLDLAKAFDRVNHSLLAHKLRNYGVQGAALAWIESFL